MDVVSGAAVTQGDSLDASVSQFAESQEAVVTAKIDDHYNVINELELLPLPTIPVDSDRRKNALFSREFIVDQPVSYLYSIIYIRHTHANLFIVIEFRYYGYRYYSNWMLRPCWLW